MSRFLLSPDAQQDMVEIRAYLDGIPSKPAEHIASEIVYVLHSIGKNPYLGVAHSDLTRAFGEEVRSRLAVSYRIYYRFSRKTPEIIAIVHGARDQQAVLLKRVQ